MIGYQGADDPLATRALARAHLRADPTLCHVASHLQRPGSGAGGGAIGVNSRGGDQAAAAQFNDTFKGAESRGGTKQRRPVRVGFVSSYLRHHSVRGKLAHRCLSTRTLRAARSNRRPDALLFAFGVALLLLLLNRSYRAALGVLFEVCMGRATPPSFIYISLFLSAGGPFGGGGGGAAGPK